MARRRTKEIDPEEARKVVGRHFRRLVGHGGVNMAEFHAQLVEVEMVEIIAGFARDLTLEPKFRKECALDVLLLARGPSVPWPRDGKTISVHEPGPAGGTVGDTIEAARLAADLYQQLDDLVRRKVPPAEWPPAVREAAGAAIAFYEGEAA